MFLKIITLSSATLLIAGASLIANADKAESHKSQQTHSHQAEAHHARAHQSGAHHAGYVKPGAAITLTHDYDGQTKLGEFETVTLSLSHIYEDGYLSVEILPTPDLQIFSNHDLDKVELQTSSAVTLPIQFSGAANGSYSIAIETVYVSQNGQQSRRVLSLPITIGVKPAGKTQPTTPKVSKPAAKGIIALPANEVIR